MSQGLRLASYWTSYRLAQPFKKANTYVKRAQERLRLHIQKKRSKNKAVVGSMGQGQLKRYTIQSSCVLLCHTVFEKKMPQLQNIYF